MTDIVIIGGGPCGMTAGLYALRSGFSVKIYESKVYGGQMVNTPEVENFPATRTIPGWELAQNMYEQLRSVGGDVEYDEIEKIERTDGGFRISGTQTTEEALAVIIANGVRRRKLDCPGEEELAGCGVSYCATCDGAFFAGKTAAVVGGGNTALEDALYLSNICSKVYLIHRRDSFRGERHLVGPVKARNNIEIIYSSVVKGIYGQKKVEEIAVENLSSGQSSQLRTDALFVAVGLVPENEKFSSIAELDGFGYIKAGEDTRTSCPGVFAAGDTRTKRLRQIVTACADGAAAAAAAGEYINQIKGE